MPASPVIPHPDPTRPRPILLAAACLSVAAAMVIVYERFGPDIATTGVGFLISLACLAAGIALSLQHRARLRRSLRGRCYACNYDLSGLPPGAPCPECGGRPPI